MSGDETSSIRLTLVIGAKRLAICLALIGAGQGCRGQVEQPAEQIVEAAGQKASSAAAKDLVAGDRRKFRFRYSATIEDLPPGTRACVWVPLATDDDAQTVRIEGIRAPGEYRRTVEPRFGNALLYFEAAANDQGEIPMAIDYLVERRSATPTIKPENAAPKEPFLSGSSLVPADGSVLKRFYGDMPPSGATREIARALYDRVDLHMKYDKSGEGWGRGDVLWACDSHSGNCSDFHSVFIALCRDLKIPARLEIGFQLPSEPGRGEIAGYHCWARFLDGDRWIAVDISEADKHPELKEFLFGNLPPDRVMFSQERDLELAPKQAAGPVNFLIYPYVEVDGNPYDKQSRRFEFEDVR